MTVSSSEQLALEQLMAHEHWLRAMVADLVGEDLAEDVLQQTWMAAAKAPPGHFVARRWLSTVARNFALRLRRGDNRRRNREREAAQEEALPSSESIVARLELQNEVANAVASLEEPVRSVLLWRYYEQLSAAEIARRSGTKESTVRSRIHRGLARVRSRLVALGGSDWRLTIALPLLDLPVINGPMRPPLPSIHTSALRVLLMGTSMKIALGTAALGIVVLAAVNWVAQPPELPTDLTSPSLDVGESPATRVVTSPEIKPTSDPGRNAIAAPPREGLPEATAEINLHGTVTDDQGALLAGVDVFLLTRSEPRRPYGQDVPRVMGRVGDSGEYVATSNSAGAFSLVVSGDAWRGGYLRSGAEYTTLFSTTLAPDSEGQRIHQLVVATAVDWAGRVVDEQGMPLENVALRVVCDNLPSYPSPLEDTFATSRAAVTTDADGRFALRPVPGTDQAVVSITKPGYEPREIACSTTSQYAQIITLRATHDDGISVAGRLMTTEGRAVAAARVTLGADEVSSDDNGAFLASWPEQDTRLVISAQGYNPLVVERPRQVWETAGRPVPWVLTVKGPSKTISGHVVDAEGRGVQDLRINVMDATPLGNTSAELIAAGRSDADGLIHGKTEEEGKFQIAGLADRTYRLRLHDPETLLVLTTDPIQAGRDDVIVRVPADAIREELVGRVVSPTGTPISGVAVSPMISTVQLGEMRDIAGGKQVVTDDEGRFTLKKIPRRNIAFRLSGPDILPDILPADVFADQSEIRLVAARRCHFRFLESLPQSDVDEVMLLDSEKTPLRVLLITQNRTSLQRSWKLGSDASPVLAVPETATQLGYFKNGELVRTKSIVLVFGSVTEIQP